MKKWFALVCALALLADIPFAASCISYDQDCSSNPGNCCGGLVCQEFRDPNGNIVKKCTQKSNICTNQPEAWQSPMATLGGGTTGFGPYNATLDLEKGIGAIGSSSPIYKVGWFSDWRTASLIGVAIAIGIIAIAAIIGHSFNLPEVKAFASSELMQALASALLVLAIMGAILFLDGAARLAIEAGNLPVACNPDEPCYMSAAKQYLENIYSVSRDYAVNSLRESYENQKLATRGLSLQFNVWYLAFAGTNIRLNAGNSIKAERASAIFETVSRLMASIYAQKYFLEMISFAIAPIFLLLGIILRTFFFTRKLGGLMLAIAVSLFIVYPLTYAFAWYTLNVTVYGERTLSVSDPACPSECTLTYPVAFYVNQNGEIVQFRTTQEILRAGLNATNWASGEVRDKNGNIVAKYSGLVACKDLSSIGIGSLAEADSGTGNYENGIIIDKNKNWVRNQWVNAKIEIGNKKYTIIENDKNSVRISGISGKGNVKDVPYKILVSNEGGCGNCPDYCREVPFPHTLPGCNITSCSTCNAGCKIMRQRSDCKSQCNCPADCLVKQPTENKCYYTYESGQQQIVPANLSSTCQGCDGCPAWCKMVYQNPEGKLELIYKDEKACDIPACKPLSLGGKCPEGCMYVTKLKGDTTACDDLCTYRGVLCPKYCRIADANQVNQTYDISPDNIIMNSCLTGAIGEACKRCPEGCKIEIMNKDTDEYLQNCAPFPKKSQAVSNCEACPTYCRFTSFQNYTDAGAYTVFVGEDGLFVPASCSKTALYGLNCTSPAACGAECKSSDYPAVCLPYDSSSQSQKYCRLCPDEARVRLKHQDKTGKIDYFGPAALSQASNCDDQKCAPMCKNFEVNVPNQITNPACKDYNASSQVCTQQTVMQNVCGCHPASGTDQGSTDLGSIGPNLPLGSNCNPPCSIQQYCDQNSGTCVSCNPPCDQGFVCTPSGCVQQHSCPPGTVWDCRNMPVVTTVCNPDYSDCQRCPIKCRVSFSNPSWLDSSVCTQQACEQNCDISCKAAVQDPQPQMCSPYLGYGNKDPTKKKIDEREAPYNQRDSCKQCPENCRIKYWNPLSSSYEYYEGDCGIEKNNYDPSTQLSAYIDCTLDSCPDSCRTEVPMPSEIGVCGEPKLSRKPCIGCSALCRRSSEAYPPMPPRCNPACGAGQYCDISKNPPQCTDYPGAGGNCQENCYPDEYCDNAENKCKKKAISSMGNCPEEYCGAYNPEFMLGCTETCKLPDPPEKICDSCVDCPTDCLYTPPTRTDCSEVCTEEALAGPINIGPSDFVKKLPGAEGEVDVKNVGVLMIPALVLPMFGIVMVIAFIRVLSPLLGGDMDIPGIGRII